MNEVGITVADGQLVNSDLRAIAQLGAQI